jgi:hypothetical protein
MSTTWICIATNTYFTNSSLNPAGAPQQFALFTLASNLTTYFIGVEDNLSYDAIEGWGDYQDIVIRVGTSSFGTPEPATFLLVGAGVLGLFKARRRVRRR